MSHALTTQQKKKKNEKENDGEHCLPVNSFIHIFFFVE